MNVETTIRDACDLGYLVTLVEDACTTVTPELHEGTIRSLRDRYASILTTDDIEKRFADVDEHVIHPDVISIRRAAEG